MLSIRDGRCRVDEFFSERRAEAANAIARDGVPLFPDAGGDDPGDRPRGARPISADRNRPTRRNGSRNCWPSPIRASTIESRTHRATLLSLYQWQRRQARRGRRPFARPPAQAAGRGGIAALGTLEPSRRLTGSFSRCHLSSNRGLRRQRTFGALTAKARRWPSAAHVLVRRGRRATATGASAP